MRIQFSTQELNVINKQSDLTYYRVYITTDDYLLEEYIDSRFSTIDSLKDVINFSCRSSTGFKSNLFKLLNDEGKIYWMKLPKAKDKFLSMYGRCINLKDVDKLKKEEDFVGFLRMFDSNSQFSIIEDALSHFTEEDKIKYKELIKKTNSKSNYD